MSVLSLPTNLFDSMKNRLQRNYLVYFWKKDVTLLDQADFQRSLSQLTFQVTVVATHENNTGILNQVLRTHVTFVMTAIKYKLGFTYLRIYTWRTVHADNRQKFLLVAQRPPNRHSLIITCLIERLTRSVIVVAFPLHKKVLTIRIH
jgi:hypothetical protein